ncbi:hypothetical protein [Micromonospora ureilytica]
MQAEPLETVADDQTYRLGAQAPVAAGGGEQRAESSSFTMLRSTSHLS